MRWGRRFLLNVCFKGSIPIHFSTYMRAFKSFVGDYNREVAPLIKHFFDSRMDKVSALSPLAVKQLKDLRDFMEGGKKSRGSRMVLGY